MKIRSVIFFAFVFALFAGTFFGQSPSTLRFRCPNTSVYAIVGITAVGDINVQPCSGKTTTFTQNVVLPAGTTINGGNVVLANGSAASPSLRFLNSPTTGVYRFAADTVGVSTAGVINATFAAAADTFRATKHAFVDAAGGNTTTMDETGVNVYNIQKTNTAGGTVGAQTINKPGGTINIAAGQAAVVLTNNTITTASLPFVTLRTADATCTFVKSAVPTANTLTITLNAACGAETSVAWFVLN